MRDMRSETKIVRILVISMLIGIFIHMYILTNKLLNYDEVSCVFGGGGNVTFGRWFYFIMLMAVRKVFGIYSMPWLYGIFSVFFLACSVVCIVYIFDIKNMAFQVMIAFLFMSIPVIPVTLAFMFLSPFYCAGIFMGTLAVLLLEKRKSIFLSGLLIACTMGVYQAYIGYILGLMLLVFIFKCLKEEHTQIVRETIPYILSVIVGAVGYIVLSKVMLVLTHSTMTDYKGLNEVGFNGISGLISKIMGSYRVFIESFTTDYYGLTSNIIFRILLVIGMVVSLIVLFVRAKGMMNKIFLAIFVILMPMAVNVMFVLCEESDIYTLMLLPFVIVLFVPVILLEKLSIQWNVSGAGEMLHKIIGIILIGCVSFEIVNYVMIDNEMYLKMQMSYNQAYSYYNTVVTQIKSLNGYKEDMPVAFIGNVSDSTLTYWQEFANLEEIHGIGETDGLINIYSRIYFVQNYVGFSPTWIEDTKEIEESIIYQQMPTYPNSGSIKIVDDVVVVKFD